MLNYFSVLEIYNIVDRSIDEDYLFISRSDSNSKKHGNTIAGRLIEFGEMANRDEITLIKISRKDSLQRSELSKIFYELAIDGNDEGFYECPLNFWKDTLKLIFSKKPD